MNKIQVSRNVIKNMSYVTAFIGLSLMTAFVMTGAWIFIPFIVSFAHDTVRFAKVAQGFN